MPRVEVTVAADRTAHLTVGGTQRAYPDLGAAMSALAQHAQHNKQRIDVTVHDGNAIRSLVFSQEGRLMASGAPPRPPEPPSEPQPAQEPEPEPPATPGSGSGRPDRFSGPAPTPPPKPRKSPAPRKAKQNKQSLFSGKRGLTVPGIVLAILLVGVIAAYFVPTFIGSPDNGTPQDIETSANQNPNGLRAIEDARSPVPGFSNKPKWEHKVPSGASVTASDRGVLIVDGKNLQVLDPLNGRTRYESTTNGELEFAVDTHVGTHSALVWRIKDKAYALLDGETRVRTYPLPKEARMSSAGTHVLIKSGNELSTLGEKGLKKLPTPDPGSTPMALDGDTLISARFAGPVALTNIESGEVKKVSLEKPSDDLHVIRWVSAGHGKVITLWGEPGSSVSSGHRIQVVINHLDTGKIASTVATSTDTVGEANWVRGQGYELAIFGPYMFSMQDGLLVQDGTVDHVSFNEPRGNVTPAMVNGTQTLVMENVAYKSNAKLLAVGKDDSFAIVRSNPETISGYTN